ncbi:MAG: succinate dehydrogenase, cytochrome b556 subunit [Alphaproteobacteria bacterium]|nr:succinate dehydrogenase, cytochrome b556 subunit [Alphaproteobacteria bacterium]
MPAQQPAKTPRPLSPHLQVYRPQLTSGMSIFHRMTGVGLLLGLPVLVAWLWAAAFSAECFAQISAAFSSSIGLALLSGWVWAFFYHLCSGIRHLFWDAGLFLEIKQVYTTGYLALIVSAALTLLAWAPLWGFAP